MHSVDQFSTASSKAETARVLSSIGSDSSEGEEDYKVKKTCNHHKYKGSSTDDSDIEKIIKKKTVKKPTSKVLQNIASRNVYKLPSPPAGN